MVCLPLEHSLLLDTAASWAAEPAEWLQGGYFVVNGSEKVLIAQERMANNHVYVFRKKQPSKFAFTSEVRCGALLDIALLFRLCRAPENLWWYDSLHAGRAS